MAMPKTKRTAKIHVQAKVLSASEVLSKFNAWRMQGRFCDVNLQAKDGISTAAHRLVLAAASHHLANVLLEESMDVICFRLSQKELGLLLDFVYGTDISLTSTEAARLTLVAKEYHFDSLCEALMQGKQRQNTPKSLPNVVKKSHQKDRFSSNAIDYSAEKDKGNYATCNTGFGPKLNRNARNNCSKQQKVIKVHSRKYLAHSHRRMNFSRSKDTRHPCYKCFRCFSSKSCLQFHEKLKHSGFTGKIARGRVRHKHGFHTDYSVCVQTNNSVTNSTLRNGNIQRWYRKSNSLAVDGSFVCTVCFKACKSRNEINEHLKTHDMELTNAANFENKLKNKKQLPRSQRSSFPEDENEEHLQYIDTTNEDSSAGDKMFPIIFKDDTGRIKEERPQKVYNGNIIQNSASGSKFNQQNKSMVKAKKRQMDKSKRFRALIACSVCRLDKLSKHGLELHMAKEHGQGNRFTRAVPCPVCQEPFDFKVLFVKHVRNQHKKEEPHWSKVCVCNERGCDVMLPGNNALETHMNSVHSRNFQCDQCNNTYKARKTLNHHKKVIHELKELQICKKCGKMLRTPAALQKHESGCGVKEKPNKCPQCNYSCVDVESLQYHLFARHGIVPRGGSVHMCEVCGYQTTRNSVLKKHMILHSGTKNMKCSFCDRAFYNESHLRQHMKVHSDTKPFQCTLCDYRSKKSTGLRQHIRLQHTHKGLKPYKCPYCDHRSTVKWNCTKHITNAHPGKEVKIEQVLDISAESTSHQVEALTEMNCNEVPEDGDIQLNAQDEPALSRGDCVGQVGGKSCTGGGLNAVFDDQNRINTDQFISGKSPKEDNFIFSFSSKPYSYQSGCSSPHVSSSDIVSAASVTGTSTHMESTGSDQQENETSYHAVNEIEDASVCDMRAFMSTGGLW